MTDKHFHRLGGGLMVGALVMAGTCFWRSVGAIFRFGTCWTALLLGLFALVPVMATADIDTLPVIRAERQLEGRALPDIPLRLADNREVMLSDLAQGQDLLVTFFYRRCAGVCTPFLHWIAEAAAEVGGLGRDYRILALSFDQADGVYELADQARVLGLSQHPHWQFAVTGREALAKITGALGFWYRRESGSNQYDHASLLVAVRDGRVVRALLTGPGETQRLRELVWELRGHFVPYYPVQAGAALRCFSFDPASGRLRLGWGMLLLVLPALVALAAALVLFWPSPARTSHPW